MNFDTIENLSEEDIINLYENEISDEFNNSILLSACCCGYGSGANDWIDFGIQGYGGCIQMRNNYPDSSTCNYWCTSVQRASYRGFYTYCWCRYTGRDISYANGGWTACK